MSHVTTIAVEVRDHAVLADVCRQLGLDTPVQEDVKFYDGTVHHGAAVRLKDWLYPAVIDNDGRVHFDHFGARWGDPARLDELLQGYSVAKVRLEATRAGHSVCERVLPDGRIRLTVTPLQASQEVRA